MPRLSPEQLIARRSFIGASDIPAIVGVSPYADAVDVLNEKLGYAKETPEDATSASELGHMQEQFVIRPTYVKDQNVEIIPCGSVFHPTKSWAAATLDAKIVGMSRGLECKAVGMRTVYDWDSNSDDGIPNYVRVQTEWQMGCSGLDEIDVAALLGGTLFRIFRIKADLELRAHLFEAGEKFYRVHMLERRAPDITGSESVRTYLAGKYPALPAPVIVQADATVAIDIEEREQAALDVKMTDERYKQITARIIGWLGENKADRVEGEGWFFQYKPDKNGARRPLFKRKGEK